MSAKHSPGPWAKDKYGELCDARGERVMLADSGVALAMAGVTDRDRANTCLFISGPEIFEALAYARRFLDPAKHDVAFVDAALAKARGETP